MTWEIALGIFALLGAFATVIGWSAKIVKAITALQTSLDLLNSTLSDLKKDNREEHKGFRDQIDDHETRITVLETVGNH